MDKINRNVEELFNNDFYYLEESRQGFCAKF
jgi:hypothetical protein